jgi:hypothetical protein
VIGGMERAVNDALEGTRGGTGVARGGELSASESEGSDCSCTLERTSGAALCEGSSAERDGEDGAGEGGREMAGGDEKAVEGPGAAVNTATLDVGGVGRSVRAGEEEAARDSIDACEPSSDSTAETCERGTAGGGSGRGMDEGATADVCWCAAVIE